mmetsp:Transcript_32900/g.97054  ORF Transcript_32900/g.97054 Transcript_32900/m.97054 type:complete len:370 (-) Transcript_32900:594-1703(-)
MSLLQGVGLLVLLDVFELVPDGRRAGVSIVQQGHSRRLRMEELQLHILFNAINHSSSTSMDAKVINATLEVGNIRPNIWDLLRHLFIGCPSAEHFLETLCCKAADQRYYHLELLAQWQDVRANHGHILLHALAGDLDDLLGQPHSSLPVLILGLIDAIVCVLGGALNTNGMKELVPRPPAVAPIVRQDHRSTTAPEESILEQKATLVAMVQIGSDDLRRYDQCLAAGSAALEQILSKIDTDERGTASHTRKVVAQDITPKTELGYHHGTERRRRREQRTVDHENIDLLGLDVGLAQGILHNVKDHGLGLLPARVHGPIGCLAILEALDDARRPGGGLAGAGPLQEALHETDAVLSEASLPAHHFDDLRL